MDDYLKKQKNTEFYRLLELRVLLNSTVTNIQNDGLEEAVFQLFERFTMHLDKMIDRCGSDPISEYDAFTNSIAEGRSAEEIIKMINDGLPDFEVAQIEHSVEFNYHHAINKLYVKSLGFFYGIRIPAELYEKMLKSAFFSLSDGTCPNCPACAYGMDVLDREIKIVEGAIKENVK